ncbi:hypothetical protein A1O1_02273 [Capronia coronata CBS 617.96]|uniref:WSC domain-containing protein n=1 Tax=Capronia coronata CBS 617.96 TaxID=1182541 RepID=W9YW52_9EURO|nr:uncharacterized protein A1O1_02273 [Capronia coronata CBS 617.96]EXJ93880.1 hypothetical protein A1O1_02273 [Capronia coronata CBS 617.96]
MKASISLSAALSLGSWVGGAHAYWRMTCGIAQIGRIDPIINPDEVSGHVHLLSGASNINTSSTYDSLNAAACTTCTIQKDKSAYWTPLLYYERADGTFVDVHNDGTVVYYLGRGEDSANIIPFPPGFRMLSGNPSKRSYDNTTMTYGNDTYPSRPVADRTSFVCVNYNNETPETPGIENTDCPDGLRAQIQFQSCWDGVNLYLPDQSHVAYLSQIDNGVCPPTHPYLFPHLFYEVYYSVATIDTSDGGRFVFSQGDTTGYGFHGDFLNGWDIDVLTAGIEQCVNDDTTGQISLCPPLNDSQDNYASTNCPQQPTLVDEQVTGVLSKLPGCNEVTSGPADEPQGICATEPGLNDVPDTDGETTVTPIVGESTVTLASGGVAEYEGCYVEATNARALSGASYTNSTGMSSTACGAFCQSKGFTVFGMEYSQECYCGNAITTATASQSDCAMVCSGNRTEWCGGSDRLSVWNITSPGNATSTTPGGSSSTGSTAPTATPSAAGATYMGCYSDNVGGRALTSYIGSDGMTWEMCAQNAQSLNRKYFGIEYAQECWTGNTLASSSAILADSTCSMACKGDATEMCGGNNALTLFQNTQFVQPTIPALVNVTNTTATSTNTTQLTQYAYVGCYTEGSSGRTIGTPVGVNTPSYSFTNTTGMTVELCAQTCSTKGFAWVGVEYAQECYCNNLGAVNGGALASGGDGDCSMVCKGNIGEYCGGSSRVGVYHLQT